MDPKRATNVTAMLLLACFVGNAQSQQTTGSGFVPRHERVAASILRRKTTSGASVRMAQAPQGSVLPDVASPEVAPAPPAGPAAAEGGLANETNIPNPIMDPVPSVGSSYSSDSYPITPYAPAMSPSDVTYENPFSAPIAVGGCADGGCDGSCGAGPSCGAPGGCNCGSCGGCGSGGYRWIDTLSISLGVEGYKNAINSGESGSFGFQQGFNWGTPWICSLLGMNTQLGFRATQSDFNGSDFTAEHRAQYFVTAGFSKRSCNGWQGGFVFDYLHDDWYTTIDLGQLRGELSYGVPNGSSFGVWFATSVTSDETTTVVNGAGVDQRWDTHDIYSLFYRVQSNQHRRGQWRFFVGMTGASDGIIGSDFKVPLAGTWSLEPEFTYLIPDEPTGQRGHDQEAWNVAFNLVWYPGRAMGGANSHLLPFFDVAGNGSMITRLQ